MTAERRPQQELEGGIRDIAGGGVNTQDSADPRQLDVMDVLGCVAGDRIHERDRQAVVDAIRQAAGESAGQVDPNRVRQLLGGQVYPRVVGATYSALSRSGRLRHDGWTTNQDAAGRNTGKPARLWRWIG